MYKGAAELFRAGSASDHGSIDGTLRARTHAHFFRRLVAVRLSP